MWNRVPSQSAQESSQDMFHTRRIRLEVKQQDEAVASNFASYMCLQRQWTARISTIEPVQLTHEQRRAQ